MRQTTPPPPPCTPEKKLRFMELNAELRDLKSMESLADYERCKGTLPERDWEEVKEKIKARFDMILKERNDIY